jgi:hypothetical protein
LGVFIGHLLLSFTILYHHEPWRDELQSLSILKSSTNIYELYANKFYETHPYLYFLFIYGFLKLFSFSLISFKLLHWFIAELLAFLILFKMPFSKVYSIFFLFSYFLLYEYNVISRNYSIGILLAVLAFTLKNKSGFLFWILLLASAESNICSWIICASFYIVAAFGNIKSFKINHFSKHILILGFLILFLLDTLPGSPSAINGKIPINLRNFSLGFCKISDAFLPAPIWQREFWETSYFGSIYLKFTLSILVMVFTIASLLKTRWALIFWLLVTFFFFIFFGFIHVGSLRHHGFLLVGYFISVLIANFESPSYFTFSNVRLVKPFIIVVICFQLYASFVSCYFDFLFPFTRSNDVAVWLKKYYPNNTLIGLTDTHVSPISFYLNKPLFSLDAQRYCTFVKWDNLRNKYQNRLSMIGNFHFMPGSLLISDTKMNILPGFILLNSFDGSIVSSENYYLYLKQ